MKSIRKLALAAASACVMAVSAPASNAATIQLGFILDSSGSIGSTNWATITSGLANAMSLIPLNGTYEVSVVSFSSVATIDVNSLVLSSAADLASLQNAILASPFQGSTTNMAAAFSAMQTAMTDGTGILANSYVNLATDGVPDSQQATDAAVASIIAAGIDNISIEGIGGGVDANYLQNSICYPQACDTTSPYNFPGQGFYIGIASAADFETAVSEKIATIVRVPEPGTLALLGLGLAGLAATRRRKQ